MADFWLSYSLQGKLIMSVTYGYDLKSYNDEFIEAPVELNKILSKAVLPGAVLINYIPYSTGIYNAFHSNN
jgi:hypothetical protein